MYYRTYSGGNWGKWFNRGVMSVFNTFSQLGITSLPCTTLDVYKAMPANSTAILGTDTTGGISDLPAASGTLEITKASSSYRYKIAFYKSSGGDVPPVKDMWLATVNTTLTQLTWEKVALMTDIPNLSGYATQSWVRQNYTSTSSLTIGQIRMINSSTAGSDFPFSGRAIILPTGVYVTITGTYHRLSIPSPRILVELPSDIDSALECDVPCIVRRNGPPAYDVNAMFYLYDHGIYCWLDSDTFDENTNYTLRAYLPLIQGTIA